MQTATRTVGGLVLALVTAVPAAEVVPGAAPAAGPTWLPASAAKLPRWRGFNLLEKFNRDSSHKPFAEDDFRLIAKLGFNFVRLPMDYRVWIVGDDWTRFNEAELREIDQAVEWGGRYGVHVCLNFHRAPGYTVAKPPEATNLWRDPEPQQACARHWALFARRYRGIPPERLSFNPMNEPAGVDGPTYARVVRLLVDAIRQEDPQRLVIADGLDWASKPCLELIPLGVAQATRGYTPFWISHYKASWVQGTDKLPVPVWPRPRVCGTLYGPGKPDLAGALRLEGPFVTSARLRLRVGLVSDAALLVVKADGRTILEKPFTCGPGQGEWTTSTFKKEWGVYQNEYDRDYTAEVPAGTRAVEIAVAAGDWLRLTALGIRPAAGQPECVQPLLDTWGQRPSSVRFAPDDPEGPYLSAVCDDRAWLRREAVAKWQDLQTQGVGVMVGEWGVFNRTPHEVVLRWMEDCLANWQEAGWGWALWNFRGSFGVLDSGRQDVEYEAFEGHKLDRAMLDLLQRY